MTDLLIDLGKTKRDHDPPTMVTVIPYMTASECCLSLWQRETRDGYDEALLESIVAAIRVFVLGDASTIKWKEWEQFPVEVQSRLASFTTPHAGKDRWYPPQSEGSRICDNPKSDLLCALCILSTRGDSGNALWRGSRLVLF